MVVALSAVVILVSLLGGCSEKATRTRPASVCGFFPRTLVTQLLGHRDFTTSGTGMLPARRRAVDTANCVVSDQKTATSAISAVVADTPSPARHRAALTQITQDARTHPGCSQVHQLHGLGPGYTCRRGNTTSAALLTPGRLLAVELTSPRPPSPETATALRFLAAMQDSVHTYDARAQH